MEAAQQLEFVPGEDLDSSPRAHAGRSLSPPRLYLELLDDWSHCVHNRLCDFHFPSHEHVKIRGKMSRSVFRS